MRFPKGNDEKSGALDFSKNHFQLWFGNPQLLFESFVHVLNPTLLIQKIVI